MICIFPRFICIQSWHKTMTDTTPPTWFYITWNIFWYRILGYAIRQLYLHKKYDLNRIGELTKQKNTLTKEKRDLVIERGELIRRKQELTKEKEELTKEKEELIRGHLLAINAREELIKERDALIKEKRDLVIERGELIRRKQDIHRSRTDVQHELFDYVTAVSKIEDYRWDIQQKARCIEEVIDDLPHCAVEVTRDGQDISIEFGEED